MLISKRGRLALASIALLACKGGSTAAAVPDASADAEATTEVAIDGDWIQIVGNPDVGDAGTPNQEQVDFAIWQALDGTWQLWECIRNTNVGGYSRIFHRWEGATLTDPATWQPRGVALEADPSAGELQGSLQAPYVIRVGDTFHMFYGSWSRIDHATSQDGKTFTRVLVNGSSEAFHEGDGLPETNTRDPMVLPIDGGFRIYVSALPDHQHDFDFSRTSPDLTTWSDSVKVAGGGVSGDGPVSSECPFVVHPSGSDFYYLFRTQQYRPGAQETRVFHSRDPADFGVGAAADANRVALLPVAAPEIVLVGDQYYIVALLNDAQAGLHGVRVAKLRFTPPS